MDLCNRSETQILRVNDCLKDIKKKVVCRDDEIGYLIRLFGQFPEEDPPNAIFIQGDAGVGKSLITKSILDATGFPYAIVNCGEGYLVKLLYESVLNQLAKHDLSIENTFQPYAKCNNFLDFVIHLQKVSEKLQIGKLHDPKNFAIVIVLDKCEKLRKFDRTILMSFLKLKEVSKLKLTVLFLSVLPWANFLTEDIATEPVIYYLENYSQKQVIEILKMDKPPEYSTKFYENFLSLFLSIFYQTCHDVRELKYQAKITFDYYSQSIREGQLTENNSAELWMRSQPFFKKSLKSLYLKMDNELDTSVDKVTSVVSQVMNMELPFYSKYLLIASYLASFNPASEDKRLFLKNHGKIKKSKRSKSNKTKLYLLGPKPFSLQRWLAIVSAILDNNQFNLSANLFIEIATLVKLNLITQISDDILDGPTYKCNVGLQFIDVISKNVQFQIRNYLVDFMDN